MEGKKPAKPIQDYLELAPSLGESAQSPLAMALKSWLDDLSREKKGDSIFELEMWTNSVERFFRVRNLPLSEYETKDILNKDFTEELRIAHSVCTRMSQLCTEILTRERQHLIQFERYIENELRRDLIVDAFLEKLIEQPSPEASITLLIDSLADIRTLINDVARSGHVSFQTYTSLGKILNREIKRCRYIDLLITYKFKPHYDKIHNRRLASIVKGIASDALRQHVARVFLELFRLLNYLRFVEIDLKLDRPLKNCMLIFILIRSELELLMEFIESKIRDSMDIPEDLADSFDAILYALEMELKKVFCHEMAGLIYARQPQLIYIKVENSHGLIRESLQNAIVQIAQVFDPQFDGTEIFQNFTTRLKESLKLREDLRSVIHFVREYMNNLDREEISRLIERLALFRDHSLRYLMYRDWEDFEKFMEEIMISSGKNELGEVLNRFDVFLETLLGAVNMRSVLANYKPGDGDTTGTSLLS